MKVNGRLLPTDHRKRFSRKLKDGDNARIIAKRLTLE
jgi:hypothetical protein